MQIKDFEEALLGLSQHFKCRESWHGKIVMPEAFITFELEDAKIRKLSSKQDTCVNPHTTGVENLTEVVKKQSEDEYLQEALNAKVLDCEEQVLALERFEREKKQKLSQSRPNVPYDSYEVIPCEGDVAIQRHKTVADVHYQLDQRGIGTQLSHRIGDDNQHQYPTLPEVQQSQQSSGGEQAVMQTTADQKLFVVSGNEDIFKPNKGIVTYIVHLFSALERLLITNYITSYIRYIRLHQ